MSQREWPQRCSEEKQRTNEGSLFQSSAVLTDVSETKKNQALIIEPGLADIYVEKLETVKKG